ncbi:MAG: S1-like domain-containing RNA-binding protein [Flavobacteriales bacterium]
MKLGDYNELIIGRSSKIGLFLHDEEDNEVLLPNRYVPDSYEIGQSIRVFVYNDSEGRPISTTLQPLATVNQFAVLECKDVSPIGAFLEIGIMKDLLVPKKNQNTPMRIGSKYLVWVYEDKLTERMVATANL